MARSIKVMVTDPVADLVIRLKNASNAGLLVTSVPHSKVKAKILEVLKAEGYVDSYETEKEGAHSTLVIALPGIPFSAAKVSKSGKRMFSNVRELPRIRTGPGFYLISTSAGLMTDREARKKGVGGEVLLKVWQ